ncbi:MAG: lytic transglycosylase domain-containing protein [Spirochaetaceae bacterium]|jgi:hypothetical protein|nr:lytic transglycosylase domain-containing protein [Spirochaetaceae bacterium]
MDDISAGLRLSLAGAGERAAYWSARLLAPAGTGNGPPDMTNDFFKRRVFRRHIRLRRRRLAVPRESALSRFDVFYPVFSGAIIAAFFSVFVLIPLFAAPQAQSPAAVPVVETRASEEYAGTENGENAPEPLHPLHRIMEERDPVREDWADPFRREAVLAFFEEITGSRYLSSCVLANADTHNIAPALAFALAWEESRFNHKAVNTANRDRSVDRGLFQLNSRSFPALTEEEFFDPWLSARYGLAHLRYCLDRGGSIVSGLAMYNAGTGRVATGDGTPKRTLDYVSRILDTRKRIERLYVEREPETAEVEIVEVIPVIEDDPAPVAPRLAHLAPILRMGR